MARLLIIDSDDFSAEALQNWLRNEGHVVDVCKSAMQATKQLQKYDYDVAVIDWNLPDLAGLELCKRICRSNLRLPILLMSSNPGVEDAIAGLDAGAQDFMTKPCPLPELAARVRSLLRRYCRPITTVVTPPVATNPII